MELRFFPFAAHGLLIAALLLPLPLPPRAPPASSAPLWGQTPAAPGWGSGARCQAGSREQPDGPTAPHGRTHSTAASPPGVQIPAKALGCEMEPRSRVPARGLGGSAPVQALATEARRRRQYGNQPRPLHLPPPRDGSCRGWGQRRRGRAAARTTPRFGLSSAAPSPPRADGGEAPGRGAPGGPHPAPPAQPPSRRYV